MEITASQKKRRKINQPLILLSGLAILGLAIATYFFILKGVFGNFGYGSFLDPATGIDRLLAGGKPTIAILNSKYTQNMLPEGSTWQKDNLSTWEKFLSNDKYEYTVIDDQAVENGKLKNYNIVILPGSKSLSDREIIQIKKYLDEGGSVFATSGIASYSEDGKWRGWEFFSEVFGIKFSKEVENDQSIKVHTLRGNLPITANIPTGYPLKVATWDRPIAAEVLDPRTVQVSFWYNYKMQDGLSREEIKKTAGIVYGTYGAGRFVWTGFEINSVIGVQEDYVVFEKLFKNSMNWLSYQPLMYVKDWPGDYEAAAVIAPSIVNSYENVNNLLNVLKSERVPATFFVEPNMALQNTSLLKNLSNCGEIASIIDIGYLNSVNDTINKLNDLNTQINQLKDANSKLERVIKKKIVGFNPSFGLFDQNTINALIKADFKYILTDSLTDRSVPKALIRENGRVALMTKTSRDDYEVVRDFNLNIPEFQFYTYQEDIDRVLFEGGLYFFKFHPEIQCSNNYIDVVKNVIEDLKYKKYWIATADDIQNWYMKKNYIELKAERKGLTRISVTVSNSGKEFFNSFKVMVDLNDDASSINISSEIIGTQPPTFKYDKSTKTIMLNINNLKAGESRTFNLDYTKKNA